MKKLIAFIPLLLTHLSMAQAKYGITAGAQLTNVRQSNVNTDTRFAFNLGGVALVPVADDFDIHIQLLASRKGYQYSDDLGYKNNMKPVYLELPVAARFKFETGDNTNVFVGGGGYFALGIGGKLTYYQNGFKESNKIDFGNSSSDDLKSTDFGLLFQLGAIFRENYEGQFFVDWGLANIIPTATTNTYNRVFGINLSWYFNTNNK